jgi:hypothetical protein
LIFEIDTSLKKQAAVIEALAKVAREREQKESLDAGAGAGNNEGQEDAGDAAAPGQPDRERGD